MKQEKAFLENKWSRNFKNNNKFVKSKQSLYKIYAIYY